jgi:hypothetical protein
MFDWKTLWCFYNSSAFTIITTLTLFGSISIIIPALINLPSKRQFSRHDPLTGPINTFNRCRIRTQIFGWLTFFSSFGPPWVYLYLLDRMDGETCDVKVSVQVIEVYPYLLILYGLSLLVLLFFGLFYLKWQETLGRDKDLDDR